MPASFNPLIYPIPSVIWPVNTPSSLTIVFTAPHISAASDNLSKYLWTTVLLGIDTLEPLTFIALNPFIVSSKSSVPTSNARYA